MDETETPFPLPPEPKGTRLVVPVLSVLGIAVLVAVGTVLWWRWQGSSLTPDSQVVVEEGSVQVMDAQAINEALAAGESEKVIGSMEAALAKDAENVDALVVAAASWAQKGQFEYKEKEYGAKAVELAEQAVKQDPTNTEALRILAYAHEIQGELEVAIDLYNQAIALAPDQGDLYVQRGHAKDLAGDFVGARADYLQGEQLQSDSELGAANLARVAMREGDFATAKTYLLQLADSTRNRRLRAETYFNLSSVALHLDSDAAASLDWANKAVAEDSRYPLGYIGQARVDILEGRRDAAEKALTQAFALYPDLTAGFEWWGVAQSKLGNNVDAIDIFEEGKRAAESDIHLMEGERAGMQGRFDYYLTGLYADEGNIAEAMSALERSLSEGRSDVITFRLIENSFRQGENGFFAPLVNESRYAELAAFFVTSEPSAELLSGQVPEVVAFADSKSSSESVAGGLVAVAHAQPRGQEIESPGDFPLCPPANAPGARGILNCMPHTGQGSGAGEALDAAITELLRQYVSGEINISSLYEQCQAIIAPSGNTCGIDRDAATGVIAVSCSNIVIAVYIPDPPVATLSGPNRACVGDTVELDGTDSYDPDGSLTRFDWELRRPDSQIDNGAMTPRYIDSHVRAVTFTPTDLGQYTVSLTVTDNDVTGPFANRAEAVVEVSSADTCGDQAPTAVIDVPEQACLNAIVTADGSGSSDPEGQLASYAWSVLDSRGQEVEVNETAERITFGASLGGVYRSQLTVTDAAGLEDSTQATTTVANTPPVATLSVVQVSEGDTAAVYRLDGSGSYDPDFDSCGDTVTYTWKIVDENGSSPVAQEGNTTSPTYTFTATEGRTYDAVLRVFDPNGASDSRFTAVSYVTQASPTPSPSASPSPSVDFDGILRETE